MPPTFSSLPAELRAKIWALTFERRILHINIETTVLPYPPPPPGHRGRMIQSPRHAHVRFKALERPPVVLEVCHESRAVALKHYGPAFHSSTWPMSRASTQKQSAIYFNPDLDVVHIVDMYHDAVRHLLSARAGSETVRRIKVLAIEGCLRVEEPMEPVASSMPYYWHDLVLFEGLEQMIFVVGSEARRLRGADVIREDVEENLGQYRDLLRDSDGREWRVPVVRVVGPQALESGWGC